MAHYTEIIPSRTYKTLESAKKNAEKVEWDIRYFIQKTEDGRFFPVFIGQEAVQHGLHFGYNVIG